MVKLKIYKLEFYSWPHVQGHMCRQADNRGTVVILYLLILDSFISVESSRPNPKMQKRS